ncbi:MAG: hypothetical protein AAGA27_03300 [Pseudomonadota bacterium]
MSRIQALVEKLYDGQNPLIIFCETTHRQYLRQDKDNDFYLGISNLCMAKNISKILQKIGVPKKTCERYLIVNDFQNKR